MRLAVVKQPDNEIIATTIEMVLYKIFNILPCS